jgi:hypothetical protein
MRFLALVLVLALPAAAAVPDKGEGTLTLFGGLRQIPSGDYGGETGATHSLVQPGFLAGFGYQLDDELHGGVQIGYMLDHYGSGASELKIFSVPILIELDTALAKDTWYTVYATGGIGYSLNTSTRNGQTIEANSTAGFVGLGIRMRLSDRFAFVVEDRYTLSSAALDPNARNTVNVGGNFFAIALQIHFFSSDDHHVPGD